MKSPKLLVIERALQGAEELSTAQRIALYEGVAEILPDHELGETAATAAYALRQAEGLQLKLRQLLLS
jgi:hypothetical protein